MHTGFDELAALKALEQRVHMQRFAKRPELPPSATSKVEAVVTAAVALFFLGAIVVLALQ